MGLPPLCGYHGVTAKGPKIFAKRHPSGLTYCKNAGSDPKDCSKYFCKNRHRASNRDTIMTSAIEALDRIALCGGPLSRMRS